MTQICPSCGCDLDSDAAAELMRIQKLRRSYGLSPMEAGMAFLLERGDWLDWRHLVSAVYEGEEATPERYASFKVALVNMKRKLERYGIVYEGASARTKLGYPQLELRPLTGALSR